MDKHKLEAENFPEQFRIFYVFSEKNPEKTRNISRNFHAAVCLGDAYAQIKLVANLVSKTSVSLRFLGDQMFVFRKS